MSNRLWNSILRCANVLGFHPRACCADRRKNVLLKIEQLEQRDCPAVTVLDLGDSLRITGDAADDLIAIVDNGGGVLNVNGTEYSGISRLLIDSRAGNDTVSYETLGELSLSNIRVKLGSGDDVADLKLGIVAGGVQSEVDGGAGADEISTAFGAVLAGADASSFTDGGSGDDVITCAQNDVAGSALCDSRGGSGDDQLFCEKTNVMEGARAECRSDGGSGDDIISCKLTNLAATGLGICSLTGGAGNDEITCDKDTILGQHVCFGDGGSGDDVMNWVAGGAVNSGDFKCTMRGGAGDDQMNVVVGSETEAVGFTGTVDYSADAGSGADVWNAIVKFTPASDGLFSHFTVLLETGNDTAILNFLALENTQVANGFFSGGSGEDTYVGPPPGLLQFPVEDFEIGV